MSDSAEGILAYGISIGGEESGWKIQGVDRWEEWRPSWLKPAEDDPQEYCDADYESDAMEALLSAAGFTETDKDADGYYKRRNEAFKRVGVHLITHNTHGRRKQYILTTFSFSADQHGVKGIDPDIIATAPTELWDGRIEDALRVLGIKPVQEKPCWLLTAYYG